MISFFRPGRFALFLLLLLAGASLADSASAACSYTITPSDRTHGYGATTALVSIVTSSGCNWTVVNNNSWITILSPTSGTGSKDITYALAGNPNPGTRQGTIQVAGKNFTVTQTGVVCTYEISPTFHNKCPYSSTGSVQVSTPSPCPWTVLNPVNWITVTDGENSVGSGKVYFTVHENLAPTPRTAVLTIAGQSFTINQAAYAILTCAPDKLVECSTPWSFDAPTGPGAPTVVSTITNTLCGGAFIASRVWSFSETCGNSGSCTQTVTVVDTTPPVLACAPDKTADCNSAWSFNPPSASDGCDPAAPVLQIMGTVTNQSSACSRTVTRTWRATDSCGNASTCSQVVSITDTTPPALTCAPNKNAECGAGWTFDLPSATDLCSPAITIQIVSTVTNHSGFCGGSFSAKRTWSATDGCGNVSTCSQTVTVVDTTPPIVTCVGDKVAECGSGWAFDPPTARDGCGGSHVLILATLTNTSGFCNGAFRVTRTWSAIDDCGNLSVCSQTVSLVDTTPPVLTCAPAKSAECGTGWTFDPPTAVDACSTTVTMQIVGTVTNNNGGCGGAYGVTRTWRATDGCGNAALCSQTVNVVDTTAPILVCADHKSVECGIPWNFDPPSATDGCSPNITIQVVGTMTNRAGYCGGTFSATRTWRATDGCGNPAVCSQTVTVTDSQPPQLSCAPERSVTCGTPWAFTPPAVIDLCDGTNVALRILGTVTNGHCGQTFTATRTWESEDGCGNKSTCSQNVTVGSQPLDAGCALDRAVNCADLWTFDPPVVRSGCGAVVQILGTTTNLLCGQGFTATRIWLINDGCTNVTCQQTITVVDHPPVVVCAWNRVVSCDMPWNFEEPQVTDDCGYTVRIVGTVTNLLCGPSYAATRTWEIRDGCTNLTCSQTVEVLDQTPPTIVCLPNITVTNLIDVPHCAKSLSEFVLGGGQASDACDTFRYRCIEGSLVPTSCGYTIERLHMVMDSCGNSNGCIQVITVVTTTTTVTLSVVAGTNQPANDPCLGGNVTLCASPAGVGPFTFAWLKDGQLIAGQNEPCLNLADLLPADAGRYSVRVAGACDTVTNSVTLPPCQAGAQRPVLAEINLLTTGGIKLKIVGSPGHSYNVLRGTELGKPWNVIGTVTLEANGSVEFVDSTGISGVCRMYRLVKP